MIIGVGISDCSRNHDVWMDFFIYLKTDRNQLCEENYNKFMLLMMSFGLTWRISPTNAYSEISRSSETKDAGILF